MSMGQAGPAFCTGNGLLSCQEWLLAQRGCSHLEACPAVSIPWVQPSPEDVPRPQHPCGTGGTRQACEDGGGGSP